MANQTITSDKITVHSRGSLVFDYKINATNPDKTKTQIDISDWIVYFEVDGVPIREQLVPDPNDALGLVLKLERVQVETLSKLPTAFTIVDETNIADGLPRVLWEGTICRTGYKGAPDATNDA